MSEWNPAECVARGIKFLQESGDDLSSVNLETLDLGCCSLCMLGQLDGDFSIGKKKRWPRLYERLEITEIYGFDVPGAIGWGGVPSIIPTSRQYEILTIEWKKQLTELRKPKPSIDIDITSGSKGLTVKQPVSI
jgi:hypothetical protein